MTRLKGTLCLSSIYNLLCSPLLFVAVVVCCCRYCHCIRSLFFSLRMAIIFWLHSIQKIKKFKQKINEEDNDKRQRMAQQKKDNNCLYFFLLVVIGCANQRHDSCQTTQIEWLLFFSLLFFFIVIFQRFFFFSPNVNREQLKTHRLKIVIWYWFFLLSASVCHCLSFVWFQSIQVLFLSHLIIFHVFFFFFFFFCQHSMCARVLYLVLSLSVARFYSNFHRFDN